MRLNDLIVCGNENGEVRITEDAVSLRANSKTDWFFSPVGTTRMENVIAASTKVADPIFSLSARVSVDFSSPYDAGALFIRTGVDTWAKLAFEYSADCRPTIVSVVTRTTSDDSDGPIHSGDHVWLRVYCDGQALAFHFSEDGKYWRFLRWFAIPDLASRPVEVGFGVQSPTGDGSMARFSDIRYSTAPLENLRNGT
jgi:regulation of enolase protein 1 (concanavalin A-like superfamily)